ncbi:MAG: FAD-dependent oxidoreductase [Patescibacteria group bacterium]|nr:FAD-dependent oxidoreductase [Patescibacteria group bacterium]
MIVGNNEPKAIETFKPKDRVLTHDGTYQQVVNVMSRPYKGDLVQITSRFFLEDEVKLTPNHPVLVTTLEKGKSTDYWNFTWGEYLWLPAGMLTSRHLLAYPIVKEVKDKTELNIAAILKLPVEDGYVRNMYETHSAVRVPNLLKLDNDFFRLAGYYLAEGSINRYATSFYFGKHEQAYIRDVRQLVRKYFGITPHLKYVGSVARIEVWATVFSRLFDTLFSHLSYNKSLPHWMTVLPLEKQRELLKGLWRGDGCRRYKDFVLVTNSKVLTTQVKNILLRFGIIPSIRKIGLDKLRSTKIDGRIIHFRHPKYEITVGGASLAKMAELLGWDHPRLKTRKRVFMHAHLKDGFVLLPIRNIRREFYDGPVYNLAVGKNHSYITTNSAVHNCDGPLFMGKDVAIIGGGNSANEAGIMLSTIAKSVKVLTKNPEMKGDAILIEKLRALPNVEIIPNAQTARINGEKMVRLLEYADGASGQTKTLGVEGVFVHIGMVPNTQFVPAELERNQFGEILVNGNCETNIPGLFAAGDVTNVPYKQISIAVGQGALAALRAVDYLNKLG